jgi:hypothetical protein
MRLNVVPAMLAGCAVAVAACGTVSPGGTSSSGGTLSAASAGSAPATQSGSPAAAASGRTCGTGQLAVTLTNTGELGGQAGGYLQFTNNASAPCQLTGFPVVSGLTAGGQATTLKDAQSTMYGAWIAPSPLPVLTIAPGGSVYAVVAATDHPVGSGSCGPPYTQLRVTAPGTASPVVVSGWLPGAGTYLPSCPSASGSSTAEVSAVTPLSGLAH